MNSIMGQRLAAKKRELENQQSNYKENAINTLLYMKKLKTEIAELELVMQLKEANEL